MRLRIRGVDVMAVLTTDHAASRDGLPVLVLEDGTAIGPGDAILHDVQLTEATPDDRQMLRMAGYDSLADAWTAGRK
jgi:hypothetical protein